MNERIAGKIDVTKIDKGRLFKGKKGTYLDFIMHPTPDSQYGDDYMICQSVSKEERAQGIRGAALGNARILASSLPPRDNRRDDSPSGGHSSRQFNQRDDSPAGSRGERQQRPAPPVSDGLGDDDIPF